MTYALVAFFVASGTYYIEQRGLNLQACAGQAALSRMEYLAVLPKLDEKIGEVQWRCVPERLMTSTTDQHGISLDK